MARKSSPEFMSQFYERPGTREARSLHKALNQIASKGVRTMSRDELKKVGLPVIREAKKRMRILEEEGLTDSPAYQYIKERNLQLTTGGKNLNAIRQNVMEAFNFLHTKTSVEQGAREYADWLNEHLGAETTPEQREMIWDLVHRFEESHPGRFINYGYDEAIKRIAKSAQMSGFDIDKAYKTFSDYLAGQGELADMERNEGEELDRDGASPWYKGRNSMDGF